MDEKSLAQGERTVRVDQEGSEQRDCFYCLWGWVFLGSLNHDGEEIAMTGTSDARYVETQNSLLLRR